MSKTPQQAPDTKPGDFVGTDSSGRVRIDRVIPLHWVLGIILAGVLNAAATYYGQQQLVATVAELKTEVRATNDARAAMNNKLTEHSVELGAIKRRVEMLESRKP